MLNQLLGGNSISDSVVNYDPDLQQQILDRFGNPYTNVPSNSAIGEHIQFFFTSVLNSGTSFGTNAAASNAGSKKRKR